MRRRISPKFARIEIAFVTSSFGRESKATRLDKLAHCWNGRSSAVLLTALAAVPVVVVRIVDSGREIAMAYRRDSRARRRPLDSDKFRSGRFAAVCRISRLFDWITMLDVRRREFITLVGGAAAAWPIAARAQPKPARIALLGSGGAQSSDIFLEALKQGLAENGLIEGEGYVLDVRWAEGEYRRFPGLAAEVAKRNPNLIVATTIAAVRAAQHASATIPIVMTTINDPVGAGLITSLARPGGSTTGIANLSEDVTQKALEILREIIPTATVIAALFNPANPSNVAMLDKMRSYARTVGAMVNPTEFTAPRELEQTFATIAGQHPDALLVINDAAFLDLRARIMELALRHRLPVASSFPELTDAGALAGYGPSRVALYRRSAYYVKRILDGAKPADLPVEQPTRIELSVNLTTAKALGILIPDSFLARVDRVIE